MAESEAETTTSTHRLSSVKGVHLFKVAGQSLINSTSISFRSKPFRVGGHDWDVEYYPDGYVDCAGEEHTSVFVNLKKKAAGQATVRANVSFSIQGNPDSPATGVNDIFVCNTKDFSAKKRCWGFYEFVKKADLATSGCLKNDCLVIKCTVEVITADTFEGHGDGDMSVIVAPSELSRDIGKILEVGLKPDLTVKIGSLKTLRVHTCVLAAGSPVFRAQLCGSKADSRPRSITIDDIDVSVFEALLQYMYKDALPPFMEEATEEARNMAQHLLVAADRYAMERLKLICESKLSKTLDVETVGFTLDFAEHHNCQQLKNCCVKYMARYCQQQAGNKRSCSCSTKRVVS